MINHMEVLKALIGNVQPTGDTTLDEQRFENLKSLCACLNDIVMEVHRVAHRYKNASEHSVQRSGKYADDCLKNIVDSLV